MKIKNLILIVLITFLFPSCVTLSENLFFPSGDLYQQEDGKTYDIFVKEGGNPNALYKCGKRNSNNLCGTLEQAYNIIERPGKSIYRIYLIGTSGFIPVNLTGGPLIWRKKCGTYSFYISIQTKVNPEQIYADLRRFDYDDPTKPSAFTIEFERACYVEIRAVHFSYADRGISTYKSKNIKMIHNEFSGKWADKKIPLDTSINNDGVVIKIEDSTSITLLRNKFYGFRVDQYHQGHKFSMIEIGDDTHFSHIDRNKFEEFDGSGIWQVNTASNNKIRKNSFVKKFGTYRNIDCRVISNLNRVDCESFYKRFIIRLQALSEKNRIEDNLFTLDVNAEEKDATSCAMNKPHNKIKGKLAQLIEMGNCSSNIENEINDGTTVIQP